MYAYQQDKLNFAPHKADQIEKLHERVASRLRWVIDTNQGLYLKLGQALGEYQLVGPGNSRADRQGCKRRYCLSHIGRHSDMCSIEHHRSHTPKSSKRVHSTFDYCTALTVRCFNPI